jgi:sporulation protein YlmC with PRC-barrel domain
LNRRLRIPFIVLVCLALPALACRLATQTLERLASSTVPVTASPERPSQPATAPSTQAAVPSQTVTPTHPTPAPNDDHGTVRREKPPQSQAAVIQPAQMRLVLTHLSNLLGYQVLDENGEALGVASDYIVNTCETYIVYILMEPSGGLAGLPAGRVVIPFEAVTINSGVLDAQKQAIQLQLVPGQFAGAPVLPGGQPLTPTGWEAGVRDFWSQVVRIGKLATGCNVPGGPVYKVAYASQLLGCDLFDGQGNLLGAVQEVILEPESGKVNFYVVKPTHGDGLVLVHLRAVNIPKEALQPGARLSLVLLTAARIFEQAPRLASLAQADDPALQNEMRRYWNR